MFKNLENKNKEKSNDNILSVTIQTPQGNWDADFAKAAKVGEVIKAVLDHFGFATNGQYELKLESDPNVDLEPQRPFVSYGIKDGDTLIFIDFGQAV